MLVKIFSEKLNVKEVKFTSSVNIILGDNSGANSIGKSTMLMLVDLAFGGSSFYEHNKDVMKHMGHHEYIFTFEFDNKEYYFKRLTKLADVVYQCNKDHVIEKTLKCSEYCMLLKNYYSLENDMLTFRQMVGLYSRVWGKENYNIKRPLDAFPKAKAFESIKTLIKLFKVYNNITSAENKVKESDDKNTALNKAFSHNLLKKITVAEYTSNIKEISVHEGRLNKLKENLASFSLSLEEINNAEFIQKKLRKEKLEKELTKTEIRLSTISKNLSLKSIKASKYLSRITEFFDGIKIEKLNDVDSFHGKLSKLLKKELENEKLYIEEKSRIIKEELLVVNEEISSFFKVKKAPAEIIDKVVAVSNKLTALKNENRYYDKKTEALREKKENQGLLKKEIKAVLDDLLLKINDKLKTLVTAIYKKDRKSPYLEATNTDYKYIIVDYTGTGKAYSNLIIFDIAVLKLTDLPFLIHDTNLFKNVENTAMFEIIQQYEKCKKQVFISFDELNKFDSKTQDKIKEKRVLQLTDSRTLYGVDWRS